MQAPLRRSRSQAAWAAGWDSPVTRARYRVARPEATGCTVVRPPAASCAASAAPRAWLGLAKAPTWTAQPPAGVAAGAGPRATAGRIAGFGSVAAWALPNRLRLRAGADCVVAAGRGDGGGARAAT